MIRFQSVFLFGLCLTGGSMLMSQVGAIGGGRGPAPSPTSLNYFYPSQVSRGEKAFAAQCASCHGANARGGAGKTEIDLLRSPLVLDDVDGREIGEFLKYGRPEKNMPKFDINENTVSDIAAFLHKNIVVASEWTAYTKPSVLSGDPKAGEAFFNGPVGKCNTCHAADGDMKGWRSGFTTTFPRFRD